MNRIKKTIFNILYIFFAAEVCAGVFIPLLYWVKHQELTQIQVFLKMWWVLLLIIGGSIGLKVLDTMKANNFLK